MELPEEKLSLAFHSPCFDGAVSAAVASDYFEGVLGFKIVSLRGVNYHLRDKWLSFEPVRPFAVVDFLYHPAAEFWVDHHATTFLTEEMRHDFEARRNSYLIYDRSAPSCAHLLWKNWGASLKERQEHYQELLLWADRIDAAHYESVEEAIQLKAPALQINLALGVSREEGFSQLLVRLFRSYSLAEVATRPEIQEPFEKGRELQAHGLQRLKEGIRLTEDGIAVFDVDEMGVLVNRYAPFHFFPQARYSAGITRKPGVAKITAMRNPWQDFPSAPLGELCAPLGGGGHQRVGSIVLHNERASQAPAILDALLRGLRTWENQYRPVEA